jgi:hypothetical protein
MEQLGLGSFNPLKAAAGDDKPTSSSGPATLLVLAMAALELHLKNTYNLINFDTSFAFSFLSFFF